MTAGQPNILVIKIFIRLGFANESCVMRLSWNSALMAQEAFRQPERPRILDRVEESSEV